MLSAAAITIASDERSVSSKIDQSNIYREAFLEAPPGQSQRTIWVAGPTDYHASLVFLDVRNSREGAPM